MTVREKELLQLQRGSAFRQSWRGSLFDLFSKQECSHFKGTWSRGSWQQKILDEQSSLMYIAVPLPMTPQEMLRVAAVLSYEPALKLLAELYDRVVIPTAALAEYEDTNTAIAVGLLAAARLCEVSPLGIRLSATGKEFVDILVAGELGGTH